MTDARLAALIEAQNTAENAAYQLHRAMTPRFTDIIGQIITEPDNTELNPLSAQAAERVREAATETIPPNVTYLVFVSKLNNVRIKTTATVEYQHDNESTRFARYTTVRNYAKVKNNRLDDIYLADHIPPNMTSLDALKELRRSYQDHMNAANTILCLHQDFADWILDGTE